MIVASFLLIPVAVLFLALGLINGSSSLLIASIVVSLLAAVALVIGARQATAARRAAAEPLRRTAPEPAARSFGEPAQPAAPPPPPPPSADDSAPATPPFAGDSVSGDAVSYDDRLLADQAGAAPPPPADPDDVRTARTGDEPAPGAPAAADYAQTDSAPQTAPSPDYEQASSTIGAARSPEPEDHRWRRPAETGEAADEFDEPDADDPDDEPLPQSVRPADAVLIARLDLEVLVVDGRPRYHLADCPHLVGRLTEPLPANEAVELGFSPCGLCRPVDRLVATVAPR